MTLLLRTNDGKESSSNDVFMDAVHLLNKGNIIAIKGVGGFHLACDARNEQVVEELRKRKKRKDKPFALMAKDMDAIKKICLVSPKEEEILNSNRRPIVLLSKKPFCNLPENIAPGMQKLGIMLPYTYIHASLFSDRLDLLVMTSGNISNSPIQYKEPDAFVALSSIADFFICHKNDIEIPLEDSVIKVFEGKESIVRKGRGYAPFKIAMDMVKSDILALGSEQKGAFSISKDGFGYLSGCFGDMKDMKAYQIYQYAIGKSLKDIDSNPSIIAYDMHPSYITTQYASKLEGIKIPIQHHHAHMVSCMAEHNILQKVIGIIYDGTGYGTDGAIWGSEFFVGDIKDFERVGHFKYVSLQGGDQSIKEPWRTALSYLHALGHDETEYITVPGKDKKTVIKQALNAGLNCYPSSSMGRLFDCISSLLGICQTITYDAQAAILLETILDPDEKVGYEYKIYKNKEEQLEIGYKEIIENVLRNIDEGISVKIISARFHNTVCNITVDMAMRIREMWKVNTVVLSGGCFENTYLLSGVLERLRKEGFDAYYNQQIPINDSGISIGQLTIGGHRGDSGDGSFCPEK